MVVSRLTKQFQHRKLSDKCEGKLKGNSLSPTHKSNTVTVERDIKKGEKIQFSRFIKMAEADDGQKYQTSSYAVTLITK